MIAAPLAVDLQAGTRRNRMPRLSLLGECEERIVAGAGPYRIGLEVGVVERRVLEGDGRRRRRRGSSLASRVRAGSRVCRVPEAGGGEATDATQSGSGGARAKGRERRGVMVVLVTSR